MIPENDHLVVGRRGLLTETEKIRQGRRVPHIDKMVILQKSHAVLVQHEPLGAVGIDHGQIPRHSAACLDDDLDLVGQLGALHLADIRRCTSFDMGRALLLRF